MKDIPGYEGLYAADPSGKIWGYAKKLRGGRSKDGMRTIHERFLKPNLVGQGYESISLCKNGIHKKFLVHRLIAIVYIPNPKKLKEINHKNGNRLDNRLQNLEWVSSSENKQHAINRGLYNNNRGSKHHAAKLDYIKVKKIRSLLNEMSQSKIAKKYGVTLSAISDINRGITWKHVS